MKVLHQLLLGERMKPEKIYMMIKNRMPCYAKGDLAFRISIFLRPEEVWEVEDIEDEDLFRWG